jgi:thiol-disulfide isomerase/thioredoxin
MSAGIDEGRRRFLTRAVMTAAASRLGALAPALTSLGCATPARAASAELASLRGAATWFNSPPLTAEGLQGRVVLVDFCTYTCINWLRSLPYVRAWDERYRESGLVVVGAHTPEFTFEHDPENVRRALSALRVTYPVALDDGFAIWNGFRNGYWPAVYLVGADGRVHFRHFGEGAYDDTEAAIRRQLREAGGRDPGRSPASVSAEGVEAPANWGSLRSPETYLGYERTARFVSPGGAIADERREYLAPPELPLNRWALAGEWTIGREAAVPARAGGRLAYRFHARDLHLVLGLEASDASPRFRVSVDGGPPGPAAGLDVDADGFGRVSESRMYQLVRQPGSVADRAFEIEFLDPGAAAYAFTFG